MPNSSKYRQMMPKFQTDLDSRQLLDSEQLKDESTIVASLARFDHVRSPYRKFHKELKKPAIKKPVRSSSRMSSNSQSKKQPKPVESENKSRYMRINCNYQQPKKPIITLPRSLERKPIKSSLSIKGSGKISASKSPLSSSFVSAKDRHPSISRQSATRSNASRGRVSSAGRSHSSLKEKLNYSGLVSRSVKGFNPTRTNEDERFRSREFLMIQENPSASF